MGGDLEQLEQGPGLGLPASASAKKPRSQTVDRDDIRTYGLDYVHFCQKVKKLTSIDLESYKGQQMHRRLESYRSRNGMPDFTSLANSVQRDPAKLRALVDFLTINVSEFFRNPDQWKVLREKVLPALIHQGGGIKAWSAGSSAGQEAYTLAITLCEAGAVGSTVLGTDIDEPSLKKAEAAVYTKEEVAGIPRSLLVKYFVPDGTGYLANETLRKMVSFRRKNLLSDQYPSGLDLVMCRNVLIYFTDKGKNQVIAGLANSLREGGVLFTGATEAIFNPGMFGLVQMQPFFYRRLATRDGR
ncbi:MAG: CheR family methyltransferase [Bacillota bacterium]